MSPWAEGDEDVVFIAMIGRARVVDGETEEERRVGELVEASLCCLIGTTPGGAET